MPKMRIRGIGQLGVIKDTPPFELQPNAFTDARNVRFRSSNIEKFNGYFPVRTENQEGRIPMCILQRGSLPNQIYATKDSIYLIEGKEHLNVSKDDGHGAPFVYSASFEDRWFYTDLSNAIVLNNKNDNPQGLIPLDNKFKDLPGWGEPQGPTGPKVDWKAGRIRAFRNYLIALDMQEDTKDLPQRVRWSNVAYVNDLPPDWIENDEDKDGGFNDLSDCVGSIVDGASLRDSFVIYTDKETYLMDYVGGILVFQFRKLYSDTGLLAPNCMAEFEGQHFVISQNDIFVHNGSSKRPIASGRIKDYLIGQISKVNPKATKVIANPPYKEIWVCYVAPGNTNDDGTQNYACNRAAVWNWEYDNWTFYDLPDTYDTNIALPPSADDREWSDFTNLDQDEWDAAAQQDARWRLLGQDFIRQVMWGASKDGCLYLLDEGQTFDRWDSTNKIVPVQTPVYATLERTHLDMDEVVEDIRSYKLIREVTPQLTGSGNLSLHIGGSENSVQAPTWSEYQTYDIENDVKYDVFSNYRYPALRFSDHDLGEWNFSGYDLDFVVGGNR